MSDLAHLVLLGFGVTKLKPPQFQANQRGAAKGHPNSQEERLFDAMESAALA